MESNAAFRWLSLHRFHHSDPMGPVTLTGNRPLITRLRESEHSTGRHAPLCHDIAVTGLAGSLGSQHEACVCLCPIGQRP